MSTLNFILSFSTFRCSCSASALSFSILIVDYCSSNSGFLSSIPSCMIFYCFLSIICSLFNCNTQLSLTISYSKMTSASSSGLVPPLWFFELRGVNFIRLIVAYSIWLSVISMWNLQSADWGYGGQWNCCWVYHSWHLLQINLLSLLNCKDSHPPGDPRSYPLNLKLRRERIKRIVLPSSTWTYELLISWSFISR